MFNPQVPRRVDDGLTHAFRMIDVFAKDDRLIERIRSTQVSHDSACHKLRALIQHENAIHVFLVVFPHLNRLTKVILHSRWRYPAFDILIDVDTYDLVRSEESI